MSEDQTQALIVRPTVLPSTAQFSIMRDLAIRLASAKGFLPAHYFLDDRGQPASGEEKMAKVLAAIEYGRAVGIEPMIALQNITMIKGKAGASAMLIGAQLRRAGYKIETSWYDKTGAPVAKESPEVWGCKVVVGKRGEPTGDGVFSLTDAQRAGLLKEDSGWQRYPKDMLYARALTQAAREGAQDAVLGMAYTAEELGGEADYDGNVETVKMPASNGPVIEADVVPAAPGVSEAAVASPPPVTVIQPAPPAPPADGGAGAVMPTEEGAAAPTEGRDAGAPPATTPPQVVGPVTPLGGPAFARRMGAGRSVGPAPKRANVVSVEQGAEKPATAPEVLQQPTASEQPVPSQPAPPGLMDEPVVAAPVDDGLGPQREMLRQSAADLARVNTLLRNTLEHAIKGEDPEPIPPATPNPISEQGLAGRIDQDFPGRTLANLGAAELQSILERFEANLAKKRALMLERGISEVGG